jgi:RNA polymerase sigma-70 factor (ECF subfamily)
VGQDERGLPAQTPKTTAEPRRLPDADEQTKAELMRIVEPELHRLAAWRMRGERGAHTLQTTALVNEAYIRLFGTEGADFNDRNHFLAVASRVMRQVLVDYARARHASKRAGDKVSLDSVDLAFTPMQPDLLDIHWALEELAAIAPRQAQLVELRFFGGLSVDEAASVLQIAPRTADKDWVLARAWLRRRLAARPDRRQHRSQSEP